jgi:hypothetical protein
MTDLTKTISLVTQELESQALNGIVAGFSFAAALSWMDLARWLVTQLVKVPKNGGAQYALTAVMTTLISILVFLIVSRLSNSVTKPATPVYAIMR